MMQVVNAGCVAWLLVRTVARRYSQPNIWLCTDHELEVSKTMLVSLQCWYWNLQTTLVQMLILKRMR